MTLANFDAKGIGRFVDSTPKPAAWKDYMNLPLESISDALPHLPALSSAARDAYWGTPANAAARRALQDRAATTIRLDKGYSERYFANKTDGGANPGGNVVQGWKPVHGQMPFCELALTAKSIANNSEVDLGITAPDRAYTETSDLEGWHDAVTNPNRITPTIAGNYEITIEAIFAANATGYRALRLYRNAVAGGVSPNGWVLPLVSPGSVRDGQIVLTGYFNGTTDYLSVSAFQNSGGALNLTATVRMRFKEPA